jgi:hypothetical protein
LKGIIVWESAGHTREVGGSRCLITAMRNEFSGEAPVNPPPVNPPPVNPPPVNPPPVNPPPVNPPPVNPPPVTPPTTQ